jgi:hypothetical protein
MPAQPAGPAPPPPRRSETADAQVEFIEVPKVDAKTATQQMAGLRDAAAPPPVSWRPQTAGWYLLGAMLLIGLSALVWRGVRRWQANRYRREAVAAVQALEPDLDDAARRPSALRALAEIVKRTRLSEVRRPDVASLSGRAWAEHLDATWPGRGAFTSAPGSMLVGLAYRPDPALRALPSSEAVALARLVRRWIVEHHAAVR